MPNTRHTERRTDSYYHLREAVPVQVPVFCIHSKSSNCVPHCHCTAVASEYDYVMISMMKPVHVGENIWMGNILSLQNLPCNFTVVSLLSDEKMVHLSKRLMQDNNIQIDWFLPDKSSSTFLCRDLIQILNVMDNSRPILVHCARGVSRSAAVCAAWLISRRHCTTLRDAMSIIRQASPTASPNLGFVAALKAIERNSGDVEAALHQWISKDPAE